MALRTLNLVFLLLCMSQALPRGSLSGACHNSMGTRKHLSPRIPMWLPVPGALPPLGELLPLPAFIPPFLDLWPTTTSSSTSTPSEVKEP
uniref:Uncharacterized protein n=1 Tax=Physcomitrium patens TaxID=3218 RepID=A0A2K1J454_PHYPA|nr:hypothetical protein PHYPA_022154 [Physcomitrium patens]